MRTEHPHAVRPAECDTAVATDPFDLGLPPTTLLATLGKPTVVDDGRFDPAFRRRGEWLEHALVADSEDGDIGRLRQFCDAAVALPAENTRIIRVDRKYRP